MCSAASSFPCIGARRARLRARRRRRPRLSACGDDGGCRYIVHATSLPLALHTAIPRLSPTIARTRVCRASPLLAHRRPAQQYHGECGPPFLPLPRQQSAGQARSCPLVDEKAATTGQQRMPCVWLVCHHASERDSALTATRLASPQRPSHSDTVGPANSTHPRDSHG